MTSTGSTLASLSAVCRIYPGYTHFACCAPGINSFPGYTHFLHTWDTLEKRRDSLARILT
jgi:hypothetical protein